MTKKVKKKRKLNVSNFNLTGFDGVNASESIDDCMNAFEIQVASTQPKDQLKIEVSPTHRSSGGKWQINLDKVECWNRNLLDWIGGGTYTPGLLPNIESEIQRNFKVSEISSFLLKAGNDLRMPVFERWLLDSKLEESMKSRSSLCDPVLPISTNPQSEASQRLFNELLQNGKTHVQAERTVAELCRKTNLECQTLLSSSDRWMRSSPLNRGDRISLENQESGPITITYKRKQWKKPFCFRLNKEHFEKLKTKFYSIHNSGTTTTVDSGNPRVMHAFNILILSLLLRYSALSGGQLLQDLRGGGMQGAIHDKVFDVLQSFFGYVPWLEGFASPFNSYLPSFCSAFPDLEWHFGSVGSFMESSFQDCCVEANPPFSIGIINEMSNRLIGQLESANRKNKLLRFVVIVPTANGTDESAAVKRSAAVSHNRLITSPFCIKYILLPARNHGYIEGAQHLRPTRYKESAYDTSVIILDSSKKAPKDMETLERKLKAAFASRHEEERKKRALD